MNLQRILELHEAVVEGIVEGGAKGICYSIDTNIWNEQEQHYMMELYKGIAAAKGIECCEYIMWFKSKGARLQFLTHCKSVFLLMPSIGLIKE